MTTSAAGTAWQFNPAALGIVADTGRLILPAGWYKGYVKESSIEATHKEGGFYVSVMIELFEPAFAKGRIVYNNYNVKNANETAEKIALAQFTGLMKCVDVPEIKNGTVDVHNKPFLVKLKIKPPQMKKDGAGNATQEIEYEERNEVQAVKHISEAEKVTLAVEAAAGGSAPAPAGFAAPVAPPAAAVAAPAAPATTAPAFTPPAPAANGAAAPAVQPWEVPATAAPAAATVAAPAPTPAAMTKAPWEK